MARSKSKVATWARNKRKELKGKPDGEQKLKELERQRYLKRKEYHPAFVSVSALSAEEQVERRKAVLARVKRYREKKAKKFLCPSNTDDNDINKLGLGMSNERTIFPNIVETQQLQNAAQEDTDLIMNGHAISYNCALAEVQGVHFSQDLGLSFNEPADTLIDIHGLSLTCKDFLKGNPGINLTDNESVPSSLSNIDSDTDLDMLSTVDISISSSSEITLHSETAYQEQTNSGLNLNDHESVPFSPSNIGNDNDMVSIEEFSCSSTEITVPSETAHTEQLDKASKAAVHTSILKANRHVKQRAPRKVRQMKQKSSSEIEKRREKNRINAKAFRERRKQLQSTQAAAVAPKAQSKRTPVTRKKAKAVKQDKKDRKALLYKIRTQQKTIKTLNQKLKNANRKYQRCKDKVEQEKKTTNPTEDFVDNLLDGCGCTVPQSVRKTLVSHISLKEQLEVHYRGLKTNQEKASLTNGIIGKKSLLRENKVLHHIGFLQKLGKKNENNPRKSNEEELREEIKKFLHDDESSRATPGKKQCRTKNKQKEQKRFLNASLLDLHQRFMAETGRKVSYSTFCKHKPFYIEQAKNKDIDSCLCITHENMDLLVQSAKKLGLLTQKSGEELAFSICCSPSTEFCLARVCGKCKNKEVSLNTEINDTAEKCTYTKWVPNKIETRTNNKTKEAYEVKVPGKVTVDTSIEEFQETLKSSLQTFMEHMTRIRHQYCQTRILREKLSPKEILIHIDFSENYSCKYAREIQSMHFGAAQQQISLHTGVMYMNDSELQSFCTISDSLRHDPIAIFAHLKPILSLHLANHPQVEVLHFKSDGPTTQYKNKTMFGLLAVTIPELFPQITSITWNFTESYHGKGAPDGIGAMLKRSADTLVAQDEDIANFDQFHLKLKECCKSVKLVAVPEADISEADKECFKNETPFVGTLSVRQVTWSRTASSILFFNSLTCFECGTGQPCQHYFIGSLDISNQLNAELEVDEPDEVPDLPSEVPQETPGNIFSLGVKTSLQQFPKVFDWVAVNNERFPALGQIQKLFKTTVHINLLDQIDENQFVDSTPPNTISKLKPTDILFILPNSPEEMCPSSYYVPYWRLIHIAAMNLITKLPKKKKHTS